MPRPGRLYRTARWIACLDPFGGTLEHYEKVGRGVCATTGGVLWLALAPVRLGSWLTWHVLRTAEPIEPEWRENCIRAAKVQLAGETDPEFIALRCLALWQITGDREWIDRADEAHPRWRWAYHKKAPARFGWTVVRLLRVAFRRPPLDRWPGHGRLPRRRV